MKRANDEHGQAGGLARGDPILVDVSRQVRLRLRHAVLHVHPVNVDVGLDVEGDRHLRGAIVGTGGLEIEHVLHTVELLFGFKRLVVLG